MRFLFCSLIILCGTISLPQEPAKPVFRGDLISITRIIPSENLPHPLPNENASMDEWRDYSYATLKIMFPEEKKEFGRTVICPSPDSGLVSGAHFQFGNIIELNIRLIRSVVKTPEEFASLLGHEFAHFIIQSRGNVGVSSNVETEADLIGSAPIDNGGCCLGKVLERMLNSPTYKPLLDAESISFNKTRIDMLKSTCIN
jgi:hypothetical protein